MGLDESHDEPRSAHWGGVTIFTTTVHTRSILTAAIKCHAPSSTKQLLNTEY